MKNVLIVFALLAVAALAGDITLRTGVFNRSIAYSAGSNGAHTLQVTRFFYANGQLNFTRFWYKSFHYPALGVAVSKATGSAQYDNTTGTVSDVNATRVTHALFFPMVVAFSETNGIAGLQANDTIIFAAQFKYLGNGISWNDSISTETQGNVTIYVVQKCVNITFPNVMLGLSFDLGSFCFYFHTGNGTYTRNGVTVYPGEFKVDKVFVPGAGLPGVIAGGFYYLPTATTLKLRLAFVGASFSSSEDTTGNGTLSVSNSNGVVSRNDTTITVAADYTITFNNGDTGYVNANKTCVWTYSNGTAVSVPILVEEFTWGTSGTITLGLTSSSVDKSSTLALSDSFMAIRKFIVWTMDMDLPNSAAGDTVGLAKIEWDPTVGSSDQQSGSATVTVVSKSAAFASVSTVMAGSLALLGLFITRRL